MVLFEKKLCLTTYKNKFRLFKRKNTFDVFVQLEQTWI